MKPNTFMIPRLLLLLVLSIVVVFCCTATAQTGEKKNVKIPTSVDGKIIDAVDESIDATNCQGRGDCNHGEVCLTHHLWQDLSDQIHGFLSGISLEDLVKRGGFRTSSYMAGIVDAQPLTIRDQ